MHHAAKILGPVVPWLRKHSKIVAFLGASLVFATFVRRLFKKSKNPSFTSGLLRPSDAHSESYKIEGRTRINMPPEAIREAKSPSQNWQLGSIGKAKPMPLSGYSGRRYLV
jgi:hypothetical protein